ncbi:MAG: hypothetical protein HYV09_26200 [Deltaproteobacteria bacterium]|nr:hypothetical protein [Deltaproteobacteria bacterium]
MSQMRRPAIHRVSAPGSEESHAESERSRAFPIVAVGASAGGLEAFTELLRVLPEHSGMAFVLVQHLDPSHASYLSEALAKVTKIPVTEIRDGMVVERDHVYVVPSNADVGILKGALTLFPRPERRPHLPIDFFMSALAADCGSQALGVVLSGTGSDGSEGLRAIKAGGGVAFAQEPRSAKFRGMPEAAIDTGVVDFLLPIPELVRELLRIGHHPFVLRRADEVLAGGAEDVELKKVFVLVRNAVGVDFSDYKATSVRRRLARRMALRQVATISDYLLLLREDPNEVQALCADMLIHVTTFFRDPAAFEKLKERAFPEILEAKRNGGKIRVWSAGCSTGEEAYSLVIALMEFLAEENASDIPIQLFGTDISERAIERARSGFYAEGVTRDVGVERLSRYFTKVDGGGYRINRAVRERCAFVKHDVTSDPPFSKIDLVSCRNLLIYFGQELQKRVLATLQFSLGHPGFLLLGHAESIVDGTDLFSVVDKENKIFERTAVKTALRVAAARDVYPVGANAPEGGVRASTPGPGDVVRRTESLLLEQYAPPASSSTDGTRSSISVGGPGRTSSRRPASRSTISSRWRARASSRIFASRSRRLGRRRPSRVAPAFGSSIMA